MEKIMNQEASNAMSDKKKLKKEMLGLRQLILNIGKTKEAEYEKVHFGSNLRDQSI